MLKTTVLFKLLIANKRLAANKINDIKNSNKLIEKSVEPKSRKLFQFQKVLKFKNLSKNRNSLNFDG